MFLVASGVSTAGSFAGITAKGWILMDGSSQPFVLALNFAFSGLDEIRNQVAGASDGFSVGGEIIATALLYQYRKDMGADPNEITSAHSTGDTPASAATLPSGNVSPINVPVASSSTLG